MKTKLYIITLLCFMVGLYSCYDDDSTLGKKEVSQVTISAAHDTLTTSFGEELVISHLNIEQSGKELPLTYEWAYGQLDISSGVVKPYPIKDTLHVVSTDPELRYAFRDLGTFGLRLKVDNGETTSFKYFILQIDTEFSEGITILSRDNVGTCIFYEDVDQGGDRFGKTSGFSYGYHGDCQSRNGIGERDGYGPKRGTANDQFGK